MASSAKGRGVGRGRDHRQPRRASSSPAGSAALRRWCSRLCGFAQRNACGHLPVRGSPPVSNRSDDEERPGIKKMEKPRHGRKQPRRLSGGVVETRLQSASRDACQRGPPRIRASVRAREPSGHAPARVRSGRPSPSPTAGWRSRYSRKSGAFRENNQRQPARPVADAAGQNASAFYASRAKRAMLRPRLQSPGQRCNTRYALCHRERGGREVVKPDPDTDLEPADGVTRLPLFAAAQEMSLAWRRR